MSGSQLPSNIAQLVAVFVESILYGVYLITFFASLQCMFWPSPLNTNRWVHYKNHRSMFTIVLSLFVFSTLNLALAFVRITQALIDNYHVGSGAVEQLGQDWVNILKPLTVNIQTTIADYAIIYRCWVVYSRSWKVIALPGLLWLGECACSIWSIYVQAIISPGGESRVNGVRLLPIIASIWSATICLNIYATSMIVYRIWHIVKENSALDDLDDLTVARFATPRSRLTTSMKIVIDSGLMYTITSIAVFITLMSGSNSMFITSAINMQVTGIAFNLILIRVTGNQNELTTARGSENRTTTLRFANTGASSIRDTGTELCDANEHDPKYHRTEGPKIILDVLEQGQKEKV